MFSDYRNKMVILANFALFFLLDKKFTDLAGTLGRDIDFFAIQLPPIRCNCHILKVYLPHPWPLL